jgi:hypothetical protein
MISLRKPTGLAVGEPEKVQLANEPQVESITLGIFPPLRLETRSTVRALRPEGSIGAHLHPSTCGARHPGVTWKATVRVMKAILQATLAAVLSGILVGVLLSKKVKDAAAPAA